MAEGMEKGFFDKTIELYDGLNVRLNAHWDEIDRAARELAMMYLVGDESRGTLVENPASLVGEVLCFLRNFTDFDETIVTNEDGDIDINRFMDYVLEHGIIDRYGLINDGGYELKAWELAKDRGWAYAHILIDQHEQEYDVGHRLILRFGDVLDGASEAVTENAKELSEELITLIGKAKEANNPTGVLNFAKKK